MSLRMRTGGGEGRLGIMPYSRRTSRYGVSPAYRSLAVP